MRRDDLSPDEVIVQALAEGVIEVELSTGSIIRDGRERIGRVAKTTGYRQVSILGRLCLTHRIVWIAAHGPIAPGMVVNHRNANKLDNRLANLEVVSLRRNNQPWAEREHYDHQVLDGYQAAEPGAGEGVVIQEARAMAARGASRREVAEFIQAWRDTRDGEDGGLVA